MRKQEATRLQQTADPVARADIRGVIALLDRRIATESKHGLPILCRPTPSWRPLIGGCGPHQAWAQSLPLLSLPSCPSSARSTGAVSPHLPVGRSIATRSSRDVAPVSSIHRRRPTDRQDHLIYSQPFRRRAGRRASSTSGSAFRQLGNPLRPPSSPLPGSLSSPSMPCSLPAPTTAQKQQADYSCRPRREKGVSAPHSFLLASAARRVSSWTKQVPERGSSPMGRFSVTAREGPPSQRNCTASRLPRVQSRPTITSVALMTA